MDSYQEAVRAFVERAREVTGLELTNLAKQAGLAHTTLTRFMNDKSFKGALSLRSMKRISALSGVPIPTEVLVGADLKLGNNHSQFITEQLLFLQQAWPKLSIDERSTLITTIRTLISQGRKSA